MIERMTSSRDNLAKEAGTLWDDVVRGMDTAEFQSRFDAIYASADGPKTLWCLGGALNDFLRSHPAAIDVPKELVPALLTSPIVDGRIIGLKLLNRCCHDPAKIAASICDALASSHGSEVYGGLFELDNLLRRLTPPFSLSNTQLLSRLQDLSSSDDVYVREASDRLADWIRTSEASD